MSKNKIDFFLPFEFDQVPKIWDPWTDTWDKNSDRLYIWDCFKRYPYDGLLISKSKFDDKLNKIKKELIEDKNLKKIFKIPDRIKLFGDCGAFQYRNEKKPIYTPREILNYYQDHGFDMGCSIDHIIINKKDKRSREERYRITKKLAKLCIDKYLENNYTFELFGVAQGWDINSYSNIVDYIYKLGYENICIGGLVGVNKRTASNPNDLTIENLLKRLAPKLKKFNRVHIFGRGNVEYFPLYIKTGVTQFDNNIMIKAYKATRKSYYYYERKKNKLNHFTSIRIPLINNNTQGLHDKEKAIFKALKQYDDSKIPPNSFIKDLKDYYVIYEDETEKSFYTNETLLRSLLKSKPWQSCECDICKKFQIHVCVFRRRMRNTLRAFHNVFNYFSYLESTRSPESKSELRGNLTFFT